MKLLVIAALTLLPLASFAYETTDYNCQSQCISSGSMYGYCHSKCTVDSGSSYGGGGSTFQQMKQTDYTCLNNCTASGSQYMFCKSKCEY